MNFEWDDAKAKANLSKHGVDFADAEGVFDDPHRAEWPDSREDYGEPRYVTVGYVNHRLLTIVYTERGESYRLITARRANLREKKEYHGKRS